MRFLKLLLLLPIAAVLVLLAVANRQVVSLVLDPFTRGPDAMSITLPLFMLAFAILAVGVVLGYCAAWFAQGQYRKAARTYKRECEALSSEREQLRAALPATATALLSKV
ncbi:Lipopolysaccharide assembly protein A domain containing protein [Rhabdaerophilaceae bacterium]